MKEVSKEWLNEKIKIYDMTNRELSKNVGVNESEVSKWKHGKTPIGTQSQAALYWFFRCLELEKELKK